MRAATLEETRVNPCLVERSMGILQSILLDACRVRLGKRFYFELATLFRNDCQDFELRLIDGAMGRETSFTLAFRSIARPVGSTTIVATLDKGPELGAIELRDQNSLSALSALIKDSLREFLQAIAQYILETNDLPSPPTHKPKPCEAQQEAPALESVDFFEEDLNENTNVVKEVGEITPLRLATF